MRHTRHHFLFMILFFLFLILGGSFLYQYLNSLRFQNSFITYNQTKHHSCYINIEEPTIILRIDDIRAYSTLSPYLIDEIINRNLSASLGVIPKDLEKDRILQKYLLNIRENLNIEIAQHGTNHNESDINITEDVLLEGDIKIQELLRIKPVTYISPFNKISEKTRDIISKYFRVISGEEGILKEGEKIAEIGYTVETYDYSRNQTVPTEQIIEECKLSLDKTNLCVIKIHPQKYAVNINNPVDLSPKKLQEFKLMLDKLRELNAMFSTFKDIVTCSD